MCKCRAFPIKPHLSLSTASQASSTLLRSTTPARFIQLWSRVELTTSALQLCSWKRGSTPDFGLSWVLSSIKTAGTTQRQWRPSASSDLRRKLYRSPSLRTLIAEVNRQEYQCHGESASTFRMNKRPNISHRIPVSKKSYLGNYGCRWRSHRRNGVRCAVEYIQTQDVHKATEFEKNPGLSDDGSSKYTGKKPDLLARAPDREHKGSQVIRMKFGGEVTWRTPCALVRRFKFQRVSLAIRLDSLGVSQYNHGTFYSLRLCCQPVRRLDITPENNT